MRVMADLRRQIREGKLLPGEQLPSLDRLAAEHGVSRATVQRAVRELVAEGLLETRARWGTFVAQPQA
ncbi:MAG TPA: winged helix-turn-helix domain-containing protein [Streptosporangiaceae bacterium]